ncbi:hypothetical protein Tco_1050827 [Tanacetum coccineum]
MPEVRLKIVQEILSKIASRDLLGSKSVSKVRRDVVISSFSFVKSHLNYNLKKKADNNEIGDTRIDFDSNNRLRYRLVGSSNGLKTEEIETWVMKTEGIEIERWLPPPGYDEHKTIMNYTPHERFFYGHAHIWMLEEGSSAAVLSLVSSARDGVTIIDVNGGRLESNGMLEEGSYAAGAQP